ncbi:MAG: carbohydrate ABC transporter permease [Bacteroidota bacterium]
MKLGENSGKSAIIYIFYFLTGVFFLYPIIWLLSLSLKTVPELFALPPRFLPEHFNIENYLFVINNSGILKNLWNSLYIVTCTAAGTLLISIPAAYAFARIDFSFKKSLMFSILIFQMISPLVIVIPLYRYFSKMGLLNNMLALILVYVAINIPFTTWYLKGFFDTVPKELDEAALIDGCGRWQTIRKVLLPLAMPGIISVSLLIAVNAWSQFVVPFILLDDGNKLPISVKLVNLQSTTEAVTTHYLAAACVLGVLPTIAMFIILQKYIISALIEGAVKG